jgi:hypothetical protein
MGLWEDRLIFVEASSLQEKEQESSVTEQINRSPWAHGSEEVVPLLKHIFRIVLLLQLL